MRGIKKTGTIYEYLLKLRTIAESLATLDHPVPDPWIKRRVSWIYCFYNGKIWNLHSPRLQLNHLLLQILLSLIILHRGVAMEEGAEVMDDFKGEDAVLGNLQGLSVRYVEKEDMLHLTATTDMIISIVKALTNNNHLLQSPTRIQLLHLHHRVFTSIPHSSTPESRFCLISR
ncbi:hypothetical protein PIB30_041338 [Stylosanthes scabra]|uniref:Uncharacterized protein n=1 Tax=Stylosanthes scabra TaxID=79078 RepID=A0ABU6WG67_9FABA|nr:hypothetical protein [Stylosanthes scabra]